MTEMPRSYKGIGKYAFVSYAHNDSGRVYPIIEQLNQRGLNVWYDDGIKPGKNFNQDIAEHIRDCSVFLLFLSRHSAASKYVHMEITFADQCRKEIIVVLIDDISAHSHLPANIMSIIPLNEQFITTAHGEQYAVGKISETIRHCSDGAISPFIGRQRGQIVLFGRYFVDVSRKAPIEWIVAGLHNGRALLVSKYIIDARAYHHGATPSDWQRCDLRRWLNEEFYFEAFSELDRRLILPVMNVNENSLKFGTPGGENTEDRIFCLSESEIKNLFVNSSSRATTPTDYARSHGATHDGNGGDWWLRSPGSAGFAATIHSSGYINSYGTQQDDSTVGVRPAFIAYV